MAGYFRRWPLVAALFGAVALPAFAAGLAGAPAPFDQGGVKLALVTYLSAGDFYQAYQSGAIAQAKKLGVDLRVFPGKQDAAEQRNQIEQAVNLGVKGIVIDHGLPESLKDVAQKAVDAGVKVVAFDVNLDNPKIPQVEQSDHQLARLALEQAIKDNGEKFKAAYVYVAGFAPLDRRDEVWTEFKNKYPGIQEVARFGVVNSTTAASVADQAKATLRAHPEITVVFAPYDEFARGVKLALGELGLNGKVKVYSADVSTADIRALGGSNVVATLLPGANFHLGLKQYPPARMLIDAGAAVALATDFNPGTSPTLNMQFILSLACTQMRMAPGEAIVASTINAAYAVRRADRLGSLERGKQADLIVLDVDDYREIPYYFAMNRCVMTVKRGRVV